MRYDFFERDPVLLPYHLGVSGGRVVSATLGAVIPMVSPVQEGEVLAGKFRVEKVLGVGGMGVVVAARHLQLDQKVAIKFLLADALQFPAVTERFAREARAAARIQSPHVARVIDVGTMDNGAPYMVMEYLEGEDLDQRLSREGRVPVTEALRLVLQACEALAEAHAAGIVHRDLKPANLFLARQKDRRVLVKVLDFGISKMEEPGQTNLTKTSTMVGTPYYMSQEQLTNSKAVDVRADIWSLGVILYELMTGHRPYTAETMPEIVAAILQNTPDRPSELEPSISAELEAVIFKCLRSKVSERYQSVAELAQALSPFLDEEAKPSVAVISRVLGAPSIPPPQTQLAGNTLVDGTGPQLAGTGPEIVASAQTGDGPGNTAVIPATPQSSMNPLAVTQLAAEPSDPKIPVQPARRSPAVFVVPVAVLLALGVGGFVAVSRQGQSTVGKDPVPSTSVVTATAQPSASERVSVAPPPTVPPVAPSASAMPSAVVTATASAKPGPRPAVQPTTPSVVKTVVSPPPETTGKNPLQMGIK